MKKATKITSLVLAMLMLISVFAVAPLTASAETSGDYEYQLLDDGTVMITNYSGSEEELLIPDKIDGYNVTVIGDQSFRYNNSIINVTIPNGVVEIGKGAFWDCKNMKSATIPSSVSMMDYCSLGEIMGEDDGTYIQDFIIKGYSGTAAESYSNNGDYDISFESLSEPQTSTDGIYDYVIVENGNAIIVQYNGDEEEIAVPDTIDGHKVIRIGNKAFRAAPDYDSDKYIKLKNIKKVTLPESIISIGTSAFYNLSGLTEISIPENVKYIGDSAFSECDNLSRIDLPRTIKCLGEYAFYGTAIEEINLGDSLTEISRALFLDCKALKAVTIPDSIKSIGNYAFEYCESLKTIDIPKTVTYISPDAFGECSSLKSVNVNEENECYTSEQGVLYNKTKTELLLYPSGKTDVEFTIPDTVTSLSNSTFSVCEYPKIINIPAGLCEIEDYTFTRCRGLTDINVDEDNQMFSSKDGVLFNKKKTTLLVYPENKNLTEYNVPDEVGIIASGAFSSSKNLMKVNFPEGLISIGYGAFTNCSGIKSVTIPANVKRIDYNSLGWYSEGEDEGRYEGFKIYGYSGSEAERYAEYNEIEFISLGEAPVIPKPDFEYEVSSGGTAITKYNGSDTNVEIPETIDGNIITSIDSYAFEDCNSIESIKIPESVNCIDWFAFYCCSNLNNIIIPNNSIDIDSGAFYNTAYEKDENNWENGLLYIGNHLIKANKASGECKIKDGTITISRMAFIYNADVTSVVFPNSLKRIGSQAFNGCKGLSEVILPKDIQEIGDLALGFYEFYPDSEDRIQYKKIEGFKIYGYSGSVAEQYAEENGLEFISISETQPTDPSTSDSQPVDTNTSDDYEYDVLDDGTAEIYDYDGPSVSEITIPSQIDGYTVSTLQPGLFVGYETIETINIPDSVTKIESGFLECKKLKTINVSLGNTHFSSLEGNLYNKDLTKILRYSIGKDETEFIIPSSVSTIGESAFSSSKLKTIKMSDNVTTIESYAFNNCSEMESIKLPDKLVTISDLAFAACNKMEQLIIPKSVNEIGFHACGYATAVSPKKIENFKIYGYTGSIAETYAKNNGFDFIDLNSISSTDPTPAKTRVTAKAVKSTINVGDTTTVKPTVKNGKGKTTFTTSNKAVATVTSKGVVKGLKAGTVTITVKNNGESAKVKITITKKANPMKVKAKKTVTAKAKKKTVIKKAITLKKAQGKVTYKTNNKKVTVKNGTMTIAKGLKKGKAITVKVTVTAKGNTKYKNAKKTVTIKVKVK